MKSGLTILVRVKDLTFCNSGTTFKLILFKLLCRLIMTEHLGTSVRNVMTVNPVTKVSDVIRWRLDLILLGNWSLPAVYIAQEQKQKHSQQGLDPCWPLNIFIPVVQNAISAINVPRIFSPQGPVECKRTPNS